MRFALHLPLAVLCYGFILRISASVAVPGGIGGSTIGKLLKDVESINGVQTDDIKPVPAMAMRWWPIFPADHSSLCGFGYRRDTRGRCRPVFFYNESEQTLY